MDTDTQLEASKDARTKLFTSDEIKAQQAQFAKADKPASAKATAGEPFKGELTIIWAEEKRELHQRLDALELDLKDCQAKLQTLLEAFSSRASDARHP